MSPARICSFQPAKIQGFRSSKNVLNKSVRRLHVVSAIEAVKAREIIDSRGNPTVEVDIIASGKMHRAAVPSGASTGIYEALELRDNDKGRYGGKGVLKAVNNINDVIAPKIIGMDPSKQRDLDNALLEMDGTENKSVLGANAILGVSMAACVAGAHEKDVPLYKHIQDLSERPELIMPVPAMNVINGGSHAGNKLPMQEFMILPTGASSFAEAMQIGCEVYQKLKEIIKKKYGKDAANVGDEGGFAPNILDSEEGLKLLMDAIEDSGYTGRIKIGMDVAASEFFKDGKYDLYWKDSDSTSTNLSSGEEMGSLYSSFVDKYPIVSIEDPFDQDDWDSFSSFLSKTDVQVGLSLSLFLFFLFFFPSFCLLDSASS